MEGDIDALMLAIEGLDNPSQSQIKALPQYKRLIRNAERELDKFSTYLETVIATSAMAAIGLGLAHSEALVNLVTGGGFTGLDSRAMRPLLNFLRPDGPLYDRLKLLTGATVDKVVASILDGVASGFNPQKIADLVQDAFGGGLTDALRWTRTTQLYSYRDSARANYIASGVVEKWQWYAELDADTCMSCIAEHGSIHDLEEQMDSHFNCRCACVPVIEGLTEPIQSGEDWFNGLSEDEQRAAMGKEYYSAYKDGAFGIGDMTKPRENEIFGTMNSVTPLWELLGAEPP